MPTPVAPDDHLDEIVAELSAALRESKGRYRDLVDLSVGWIWEMGPDLRFTALFGSRQTHPGLAVDNVIGRTRLEIHGFDDPDQAPEPLRRHVEDLEAHRPFRDFVYTVGEPGGGARHICISGNPLFDGKGRFVGYRGIGSDITEAWQAKENLRRAHRATTALGRVTEALVRANDETALLSEICRIIVSIEGYRMAWIGYAEDRPDKWVRRVASAGHVDGYFDGIVVTWNEDATGRGPVGACIREGKVQIIRDALSDPRFAPWRDRAAARGYRSVIALPVSVAGRTIGALSIYGTEAEAFDIDEVGLLVNLADDVSYGIGALRAEAGRKAAEEALLENEALYRNTVERLTDAVVHLSDFVIVFANAATSRLARLDPARSPIGRSFLDLVHESDRERVRVAVERAITHDAPETVHAIAMRWANGDEAEIEMRSHAVMHGGEPAIELVIRDVTELRAREAQERRIAKLASLGELAAGLSHELNQPLNTIRLIAEGTLLRIERGTATPADIERQFRVIEDQARRMAKIMEHMRSFSRHDADEPQAVDLSAVAAAAVDLVSAQFAKHDVAIDLILPAAPAIVRGHAVRFEQVAVNLLTNARDSIEERRELTGQPDFTGRVAVVVERNGEKVRLVIEDNGRGISDAIAGRLFEPFATTKPAGKGTGLGLSVSFGIVGAAGGAIEVEPGQDCGARFIVTLPAAGRDRAEPMPATQAASCRRDMPLACHVLLVEDETEAARAIAEHLEEEGYMVRVAHDGTAALAAWSQRAADVVVTDMRLPGIDGFELVARLREIAPDLPVIAMSAHFDSTEAGALPAGVLRLAKPVGARDLADAIDRLVMERLALP